MSKIESNPSLIKEYILFYMRLYPIINNSCLHTLMLPTKKDVWRPVFDSLIEEGVICEKHVNRKTPIAQDRNYSLLYLKENESLVEKSVDSMSFHDQVEQLEAGQIEA